MTDYSTIGKTVMDYNETERAIACLEQQMGDMASGSLSWGRHCETLQPM